MMNQKFLKMIQSLNIQNFQSHQDSHLEFDPGVNVIVGQSDSGKTSIIRALQWLVWNRPGGDAFRSDWGGATFASIQMNDTVVTRFKDKENVYKVNGDTFRAFGSGVPEPIQQALNITEVNLQMQLDAPFLISQSPGEVAKYFNQIAHLEKIDIGLKTTNSRIRELDNKRGFLVEEQQEVDLALEQFDYLDKAEAELEVLEDLEKDRGVKIINKNSIEFTIGQIEKIEKEKEKYDRTLSLKKPVENLVGLYEKKEATWQTLDDLQEIRADIGKAESDIEFLTKQSHLLPTVETVLDLHKKRKKKQEEEETLSKLFLEINSLELQIVDVKEDLESAEAEFHENMPEQCPLCGK